MSEISLRRVNLSFEFKDAVRIAEKRKCQAEIDIQESEIVVSVFGSGRQVGRFVFDRDEGMCILKSKHIIEGEFYPLEFAINKLIPLLKRRRALSICW